MGKNKLEEFRNKFKEHNVKMNYFDETKCWNLEKDGKLYLVDICLVFKDEILYYDESIDLPLAKLIVEFAELFQGGEFDE